MGGVLSCLCGEEVTSRPSQLHSYPDNYNNVLISTPRRSEFIRTISTIQNESVTSPRYRYEESYGYRTRTNVSEYSSNKSTTKPYNTVIEKRMRENVPKHSTNKSTTKPYNTVIEKRMRENVPKHSPNKSTTKLYKSVIENSGWSPFFAEFTFVTLDKLNDEYLEIKKLFLNSTKRNLVSINTIERVQNPFLMGRYVIAKKEMQLYSSPQEKLLFHGTQPSNINSICQNNFNWRLRGKKIGHRFGQGVSFSPISHYASFYCDKGMEKVMLVARVLVGQSCIGHKDMKIPPYVDFQRKIRYDTSEKENGHVVVKYRDDEYYPAYKICFQVKPEFNKKQ